MPGIDPSAFIKPGGILDIADIPARLPSMGSLSLNLGIALLGFFLACEIASQNVKAIEGKTNYTGTFIRVGLVLIAMTTYNALFNFPIKVVFGIENAVLNVKDYNDAIDNLSLISWAKESMTILTNLPILIAWLASYFTRLLTGILQTAQFIVLSVLYFFGPLVFAASVFEPLRDQIGNWFKAIVEVCLWSLIIRVLFRIMMELHIFDALTQSTTSVNLTQFTIVNIAFVAMAVFIPIIAHRFVGGAGVRAIGSVVTSLVTSHASTFIKTGSAAAGSKASPVTTATIGAGMAVASGVQSALQRFLGSRGSKTDMRNQRDQSRVGKESDSTSKTPPSRPIPRDRK